VTVKWNEGASKKFGDHLAAGEASYQVAVAVFEDEDAVQRGALR
jgi:hypothetical protein